MHLTRRETHVLIILALTLLALFIAFAAGLEQQTLDDYQYLWLLLYVTPLGIYLATDPQRY